MQFVREQSDNTDDFSARDGSADIDISVDEKKIFVIMDS